MRRDQLEVQLEYLRQVSKHDIKIFIRIDKEFPDLGYNPTHSLGEQIADLVKRYKNKRNPEDMDHGRPYYDYEDTINEFDKGATAKMDEIRNNPELRERLRREEAARKEQERLQAEQVARDRAELERKQALYKHQSVTVDPEAIKKLSRSGSGGSATATASSGGGGMEFFALLGMVGAGAFFMFG